MFISRTVLGAARGCVEKLPVGCTGNAGRYVGKIARRTVSNTYSTSANCPPNSSIFKLSTRSYITTVGLELSSEATPLDQNKPGGKGVTDPGGEGKGVQANGGGGTGTVDPAEVERFTAIEDWWDEFGPMGALHSMNDLRIPWIRDALLLEKDGRDFSKLAADEKVAPLSGMTILDVGCGGGILCEPLARLGATVTGMDATQAAIDVAREHMQLDPELEKSGRLTYECCSVEELAGKSGTSGFDAVIASEIVEHVTDPSGFVRSCVDLLAPGGCLFVTTLNRTMPSLVLGVWTAERILRVVPQGVHDWDKFVSPKELTGMIEYHGLEGKSASVRMVQGLSYNPFRNKWCWGWNQSINYGVLAVRDT